MDLNRQSSNGDNSPNISDSFNTDGGDILVNLLAKRPVGREVASILQVITQLTERVTGDSKNFDDTRYRKTLKEKLKKYPDYAARLHYDYGSLVGLYGMPYQTAWENSDVDELTRVKIARYLSSRSISLLDSCNDNAIQAIDLLINELELCLEPGSEYDLNAIRFFIYRQFIECNVFPLIDKDSNEEQVTN